jgi:hypothetical protein
MNDLDIWPCGCKTWKEGKTFYIRPCSKSCKIYEIVIQCSKERGNVILERKEAPQ